MTMTLKNKFKILDKTKFLHCAISSLSFKDVVFPRLSIGRSKHKQI